MTKLKDEVLKLVDIAKDCPENLQVVCFELLLRNYLETAPRKGSPTAASASEAETKPPNAVPPAAGIDSNPVIPPGVQKNAEDIVETDLHVKVRHFLKKYGITLEQLNNIFYKQDGAFLPLYEDLKTTRMSDSQVRITLLQALGSSFQSGEFQATVETVRQECKDRKCYDGTNFAANYTNSSASFDFEKYDKNVVHVKLSEEGKKSLAELIKELQ
jgi:hypothetical protein